MNTFMRSMTRRQLLGATLAASFVAARSNAAQRATAPPLWLVERGTAKVFLLGQMPVRAADVWLTPGIQQAFDASTELWVENPEPKAAPAGSPSAPEPLKGPKLSDVANPRELKRIHAALARAGRPAGSLDSLPPRIAYFSVAEMADRMLGADFTAIPERVFRTRAKASGMPVHSEWASFQEVSQFLARLPDDLQVRIHMQMINRALDELDDINAAQSRLRGWLAGDISGFEELDRRMERRYPDARRHLGTERNKAWLPRIESMMARTQAAFVCVGILHLVGSESIQAQLRRAGLVARRV
jgi:uncharacterized protein YbaP (TraB family)